jgi:hypothetical protein
MDRIDFLIGPSKWCHDATASPVQSKAFYTKDTGQINVGVERFPISGALTGRISDRFIYPSVEATCQPDGRLNTALLAIFYPHFAKRPGASLFGATAVPLVINTSDGKQYTLKDAVVTKMPDLTLGTNKDIVGSISFTGVCAQGKLPFAVASLLEVEKTVTYADIGATFLESDFKQAAYSLAFGAVDGFTALEAQDGWTVSFEMTTQNIMLNGVLRDIRLTDITVMVRGIPANLAPDKLRSELGIAAETVTAGRTPGESLLDNAQTLVITGGTGFPTVTINSAILVSGGYRFGDSELRQGEIGFVSCKKITAGAFSDVASIAIA